MAELKKTGKIGVYSGNDRLDESQFEEPDLEDEATRQMWLEEVLEDPDFHEDMEHYVNTWKGNINSTMDASKITIHMVGQSHIDMAWKWRYAQTRRKGIKTYRKAMYHADRFKGEFRFAASEPQLLEWIKEDDPALWQQIKDAEKAGIIELVGGAWVEPDCMMPSGEAMIRQRLYGMRFYRDEFGKLPQVEWFLDSFGYNIGLPQILKKSGADYFWTSKLTWNAQTVFPFVNFIWQGPDGTQLLTANFAQMKDVFERWNEFKYGRHLLKPDGKKAWSYRDDYATLKDEIQMDQFVPAIGFFNGKGDGGHGPSHQDMTEMQALKQVGEKNGLKFKWSSVHDFYREVGQYHNQLPIWKDELYLETHRGTFSVHSEVKRHNRRLECLLQAAEALSSLIALNQPDFQYPVKIIEQTWKTVLLNHFHDVLPGSSVPEVYDDVYEMWHECDKALETLIKEGLAQVKTENGNNVQIFNPLPWKRMTRVFIPHYVLDQHYTPDEEGRPPYATLQLNGLDLPEKIICQPVAAEFEDKMKNNPAGWWAIVEMPAYGIVSGTLNIEPYQGGSLFGETDPIPRISNGLLNLEFDPKTGAVIELKTAAIDHGGNLIRGKQTGLIYGYAEGDKMYPAWNLTAEYWKYSKNYAQNKNVSFKIVDKGPVFVSMAVQKMLGESQITTTVRLFKDDPMVYWLWHSDWREIDVMLKMQFETNTQATEVTMDEMYCALSASTLPETPCDKARYEKIMHEYADLSTPNNTWGIALINEGKYAFDASSDRMRLTLHRSPQYPAPSGESWVHKERVDRFNKDGSRVPLNIGIGPTSARFAIFPHQGGALRDRNNKATGGVKKRAAEFNNPIIVNKAASPNISGCEVKKMDFYLPDNVMLTAIKHKEWDSTKALIIRLNEICGIPETNATILLPQGLTEKISQIKAIDLLERPLDSPFEWHADHNELKVKIKNFEILTFELVLK